MGFVVVRVTLSGSQRPVLQVMAEPADGSAMHVDDCAELSRTISAVLDVEDPIPDAYVLEVSSPGIDRPLVRLADYERFRGHLAKVELKTLRDGRRRFQGYLDGVDADQVRLTVDDQTVTLAFANIAKAKLVLTDELIRQAQAMGPRDEE